MYVCCFGKGIEFQSTLPRRERHYLDKVTSKIGQFQSTLPRRERQNVHVKVAPDAIDFNPRSREGSDEKAGSASFNPLHFNPRSREGSDNSPLSPPRLLYVFQSTLPRRERLYLLKILYPEHSDFNPRSREGSDE